MGFDLATAKPAQRPAQGGFDLSTAQPANESFSFDLQEPEQTFAQKFETMMRGNAAETAPNLYTTEFDKSIPSGHIDTGAFEKLKLQMRLLAPTAFGTDKEMGDAYASELGGQSVDDDNGNPMIQMPDGKRFYVNQPGFDTGDLINATAKVIPYTPGGKIGSLIPSLGYRAAGSGALMGATNVAGQSTIRDEIDPIEVGTTALLGAGSEYLGPIARGGINYVRRLLGKGESVNSIGRAFAAEMGYADNLPAAKYSEIGTKIANGADPKTVAGELSYGFQYTKGQRMGQKTPDEAQAKYEQLANEEPLYELAPKLQMASRYNQKNLGDQITNITGDATPSSAMGRVKDEVRSQAKALKTEYQGAYKEVRNKVDFNPAKIQELGSNISGHLRKNNVSIDIDGTPKSHELLSIIERKINEIPSNAIGIKIDAAERMRSMLLGKIRAAKSGAGEKNPNDLRAMDNIMAGFDDWYDDVIDNALVKGSKQDMDTLFRGRAGRAEYARRFQGSGGDVNTQKFIKKVMSSGDSNTAMLNAMRGANQVSNSSAHQLINQLKLATKDNPQVIKDLQAADTVRMFLDKAGKPLSYGDIVRNIKMAERESPEVVRSLYGTKAWNERKQFAASLEPFLKMDGMAKSSGTGERLLRYLHQKAVAIPGMKTVIEFYGAGSGARAGEKALFAPVKPPKAPLPASYRLVPPAAASQGGGSNQ